MFRWPSLLTIAVIVGGWSVLANNSSGQMTPPSPPLPYGAPTAESVVPLPPTSVNLPPSDPGAGGPPPGSGPPSYPPPSYPPSSYPPSSYPAPSYPPPTYPTPSVPPSYPQPYPPPSNFGPAYPPVAASDTPLPPPTVIATPFEKPAESSWYTRVDYFHWNERAGGTDFVNEFGALYTLGYQRRIGCQRFRVEVFGGDMTYDGGLQWPNGVIEPDTSSTRYLGCRGEYEYLCEPTWWPEGTFFLGVGSRFWIRDIEAGFGVWGDFGEETQETWWTLYPYVGLEIKRPLQSGLEIYTSMRVGATAITYNYSNAYDLPVYPRLGVVAGIELGLRGKSLSLSGSCEVMTWARSKEQYFYTTDANGNPMIGAVDQPEVDDAPPGRQTLL